MGLLNFYISSKHLWAKNSESIVTFLNSLKIKPFYLKLTLQPFYSIYSGQLPTADFAFLFNKPKLFVAGSNRFEKSTVSVLWTLHCASVAEVKA